MANDMATPRRVNARWLVGAALAAALVTLGVAALLTSIFQKKQEARNPFYRVVELTDTTVDAAIWGKNFPLQYDDYRRTVDMVRTRYGGSEAMPRDSTADDPRTKVSESRLEEDPRLVDFWAGYAFSKDFREERGHAYMLEDQMFTERQKVAQQPGACLQCHGSMYVAYRRVGKGDVMAGFRELNQLPYMEAKARGNVTHPVSCIDCHDPATMQLRVTRPGFMEGMRVYKASEGIANYDVNQQATRQEMRTYVCGQCHVEYYFKGPDKQLTYPWHKGLQVDSILAYYDEVGFKDWTHKISGAPVLKAQHPEFETYNQGVHARSGVACADCHMPYKREGGMKISDHHVQSPLLNINRACQGCHHFSETEMKSRVEQIQDRFHSARNVAMDALMALIADIKTARAVGATGEALAGARAMQRKAQFYIDMVEAENSSGFHAPGEALRILTEAVDFCRQGQLAVRQAVPAAVTLR